MLVLSRHRDEGITIRTPEGREIHVVVADVRGDKARLGIEADPDVTIDRDEIDRIKQIARGRRRAEP